MWKSDILVRDAVTDMKFHLNFIFHVFTHIAGANQILGFSTSSTLVTNWLNCPAFEMLRFFRYSF